MGGFLYRFRAEARRLFCRASRRHTESLCEWGYGLDGMVDLYCPNCLQLVRRVPLDDFEERDAVLGWVEQARRN